MGRGAGRANHSRGLFWCSPTTKVRKLLWREDEERKPQSCLSDAELTFLNVWDIYFPFSCRRACLGRAEPVSPHISRSVRMVAFASWVWRGVPCRTLVCSGCLVLLNIWWDFWELPWEHADDTKYQASKTLWVSENISFSVCNFLNAFFVPAAFII